MELYKDRKSVPNKYKVDLTNMFKNEEEWYKEYNNVISHLHDLDKYKKHILDSAITLEKVLNIKVDLERKIIKLYIYASVNHDCDLTNTKFAKMYNEITELNSNFETIISFITPELLKQDYEIVKNYIKENKNLDPYTLFFEKIYSYKNHTLSDKEEKIISAYSGIFNTFKNISNILTNSEIKYGNIKIDGQLKELLNSNNLEFATNRNRTIRKNASIKRYKKLEEFNNTFTNNLTACLKSFDITAKLKNFENYQQQALFEDNINIELYNHILTNVEKHLETNKRWNKVIGKCLGLKKLYDYDLYAPIIKDYNKKYTIKEAQTIIIEALKILGVEYNNIVNQAFDDKWIDYCNYKGKKYGGYQTDSYLNNPIVFTNYNGFLNDISTIAHELGHAIHSYLSAHNNDFINYNPEIFITEVASLSNEILLSDYLMKNSKDKKEQLSSIYNIIDIIAGNFFDASKQAEFEQIINFRISKDESLNKNDINKCWANLNYKYYYPAVIFSEYSKVNWCRIPHFYYPFYTYKYIIGIIGACYVASNIINKTPGFINKYISFLKSGGNDYPINQLKKLGIDLESDEPYQATVDLLNKMIDNFEKLYKEVNNEQ